MNYEDITVDRPREAVLRVVIDRPATKNAYRSQTCRELVDAIESFAADDTARVLVLTGAGGSFCSGGDLSSSEEIDVAHSRQLGHGMVMREGMHRVVRLLHACDKPTIAAVDGAAVAGGLALALCFDFRIGSSRARLGDVSGRVGLLPDEGGAWLFPRAMGLDRALRMSLLHEVYDAQTSLSLGLLTEVVDDERLEPHVLELADVLAQKAPLAGRLTKRMMRNAMTASLDQALREAELAVDIVNDSADVTEGVDAFLNKRQPQFLGR